MKKIIAVLAILALPACSVSGSDSVTMTPGGPDPIDIVANDTMGASLNGARAAGFADIVYNPTVGRVAQDHANDMFARGYLSIYELGSTDGTTNGLRDMGDDLNDAGVVWTELRQLVAQGDMTAQMAFDEFRANGSAPGSDGSNAADLDAAFLDEEFEFFGLGKSGTGADQKWALLVVWPTVSDR